LPHLAHGNENIVYDLAFYAKDRTLYSYTSIGILSLFVM